MNDDVFVYLTATNGFKSGGFNTSVDQGDSFDEEKIWSYELGVKSEWFDNRLRANASVFFYDYEDLQVQTTDPSSPILRVDNVGKAEGYGLDLDITAVPVENLTFNFTGSFLETEYKEGAIAAPNGDLIDVAGNSLTRSPEISLAMGVEYKFPIQNTGMNLTPNLNWTYKSDLEFIPQAFTATGQDAYQLFNARLTLDGSDGLWALEVFGNNLADETFRSHAFVTPGGVFTATLGPPRTYGGRVRLRF